MAVSYTHLDVYKRQAELKGSLETIRSTAANLIDTIDGHFAEIQKAQDKEQTTEQAQPAQEAAKQPEAHPLGSKKGEATATGVLGWFAFGDASVQKAAKDGGITKISHIDPRSKKTDPSGKSNSGWKYGKIS